VTAGRAAQLTVLLALPAWAADSAPVEPPLPGERLVMRFDYLHLAAGRGTLSVAADERNGKPVLRFVAEARSEGFFAWLLRYRVRDRTDAWFDPLAGCSLGIEKHLREGRAVRDQVVTLDPAAGIASVNDPKIAETRFETGPCTLDVLSAVFVIRAQGVAEGRPLLLPLFDNGKRFTLRVDWIGRETLDLPPPFGKKTPTIVVEPILAEGTGLFVKRGRLKLWLTDDARRVPVRLRTRVPIGSVSGELESYEPGGR